MQLPEKDGKALSGRCLSLGEGGEGIKKKEKISLKTEKACICQKKSVTLQAELSEKTTKAILPRSIKQ